MKTTRLLNTTQSLCPECLTLLTAEIFEDKGKVYLKKTCPRHGEFIELYWGDYEQYERVKKYEKQGTTLANPQTYTKSGCPFDCGICPEHKSSTVLGIIDVTNRCNLACPICFAHSGASGYLYEPTKEQIKNMIETLFSNHPARPPAIQFSGGEPTIREELPEFIQIASQKGFEYIMINTNGLKLSESMEYCEELKEAGANAVYLQFDGFGSEIYLKTRGVDLTEVKNKVIENLREAELSCFLVPTLVKGLNDHQIGDIINYALDNQDIIRGLNFQPVSITGRINHNNRKKMRITLPDFMRLVEEQTNGKIRMKDFFPVPVVETLLALFSEIYNHNFPDFSAHPHCGVATYVVKEGNNLIPITDYLNLDELIKVFSSAKEDFKRGRTKKGKLDLIKGLRSYVRLKIIPEYIKNINSKDDYLSFYNMKHKNLFIGAMHFMDPYNYDLERVKKCVIHYAIPDGRLIPFCTMNNLYRKKIEQKYSKNIK